MINIYTDGSSLKNGDGGWGVVVMRDEEIITAFWGKESPTTNNKMELAACIRALQYIKDETTEQVTLVADSQYVLGGCTQWLPKWERKNYSKVKNVDLWQAVAALLKDVYSRINFVWVHGHTKEQSAHHKGNALADKLCTGVHKL